MQETYRKYIKEIHDWGWQLPLLGGEGMECEGP